MLLQRLRRLQGADTTSSADAVSTPVAGAQPQTQTQTQHVLNAYLALINVLACVEKSQAWVLAEGGGGGKKRRVVTLDDVRGEYQGELDRVAAIESGRFAFVGGEMDVL